MRVQRPEAIDPLTWERLPRGARLILAAHHARTPERREALQLAAVEHSERQLRHALAQLEGAVSRVEKVTGKSRGTHDEQ